MTTIYYFWYNGNDYFYGATYDTDNSQGLSVGYSYTATDETGASGYYYVYSVTSANNYSLGEDQAVTRYYYDGDTGQIDYEPYYSSTYGYMAGTGMLQSYDYVNFGTGDNSNALYGYNGYYEATAPDSSGGTYSYYWSNGTDYYYGVTYDSDGSQGLYDGYSFSTTDETGAIGTYYVYSVTSVNTYGLGEDQAYHVTYYDGETGQSDSDLYYSSYYGYAFGDGMIGSYDYADFGDGDISEGLYGYNGYYVADDDAAVDVTYAYYWSNGTDYYYGVTYDSDGSQGLYDGYSFSTTDETGAIGTYYVYSVTSVNTYGLGEDQAYHVTYYDGETGQYDYDLYYSSY